MTRAEGYVQSTHKTAQQDFLSRDGYVLSHGKTGDQTTDRRTKRSSRTTTTRPSSYLMFFHFYSTFCLSWRRFFMSISLFFSLLSEFHFSLYVSRLTTAFLLSCSPPVDTKESFSSIHPDFISLPADLVKALVPHIIGRRLHMNG